MNTAQIPVNLDAQDTIGDGLTQPLVEVICVLSVDGCQILVSTLLDPWSNWSMLQIWPLCLACVKQRTCLHSNCLRFDWCQMLFYWPTNHCSLSKFEGHRMQVYFFTLWIRAGIAEKKDQSDRWILCQLWNLNSVPGLYILFAKPFSSLRNKWH